MKKIFFITGILTLSFLTSCDNSFLDTKPYDALSGSNIWTSDANALLAVNSIYNALGQYSALQWFCYIFSDLGPDGYTWNDDATKEIAEGTSNANNANYSNIYTALYKVISRANDAIVNLKDNPDVSKDLGNRMIGEAEFLRGISYFYLWQLFGGVVILNKPTPPGETYLPRNSADEVKQLIISDFTDAVNRLPVSYTSDNDIGRVTKGAAIAMLGKTYLYDDQWSKAAEQLEKLMSPPFQYVLVADYSNLFDFKFKNNSEDVFSLQYTGQSGFGNFTDLWYSGRSTYTSGYTETTASYATVSSYTNLDGTPIDMSTMPRQSSYSSEYDYGVALIAWYQKTFAHVDKRLQANVILPGSTFVGKDNQLFMVKWPYGDHANDDTAAYQTAVSNLALFPWRKFVITGNLDAVRYNAPTNIPVIRYADVLLMYAEAENEANGPSADVYKAIDQVRERAGIPDLAANMSKDELRESIRMERLREFAGEGILYFDVKRWKIADTNDPIFGLNRDVKDFRGESLYKKVFTKNNYLWPIPQSAMDINKKLVQNPGW